MTTRTNRHGPKHPGFPTTTRMVVKLASQPALRNEVIRIAMSDRWPNAKREQIRATVELASIHPVYDEVRQRKESRQ